MKHRATNSSQKFLHMTSGQILVILFALLMLAVIVVSVYIGKHI